ncbi:hypothetical protein AB6A40_005664 [Gnathostoma spinigerum]|uniref:Uncharacterized protein n=1 Tax=Gnathostoma spinigerum TaxID=75299 RepID=A0ABD6EH90_9BILA
MDAAVEIESLRSIYEDDIDIEYREATHSDGTKYVIRKKVCPLEEGLYPSASLRVEIRITEEYPAKSPEVFFRQPRGITEGNISTVHSMVYDYLKEHVGLPVLYDTFQIVQSFLEKCQDIPSATCPVCFNNFDATTPSLCTDCDHFIHRSCFREYIIFSKKEIEKELQEWPDDLKDKVDQVLRCPVCRFELSSKDCAAADDRSGEVDHIGQSDKLPTDSTADTIDLTKWRALQRELNVIYEKQKAKGGIIDVEEDRLRNLVTEDLVFEVSLATPDPNDSLSDVAETERSVASKELLLGSASSKIRHQEGRTFRGRRNFFSRRQGYGRNNSHIQGVRAYDDRTSSKQITADSSGCSKYPSSQVCQGLVHDVEESLKSASIDRGEGTLFNDTTSKKFDRKENDSRGECSQVRCEPCSNVRIQTSKQRKNESSFLRRDCQHRLGFTASKKRNGGRGGSRFNHSSSALESEK